MGVEPCLRVAILGLVLVACPAGLAGAGGAGDDDRKAAGDAIVGLVGGEFFDPDRADAWVREHAHYAETAASREAFVEATRRILGDLRASHTAFYTPDDARYYGLRSIFRGPLMLGPAELEVESIGVEVDADHFVRVVFVGSAAEAAGLRRGDRIVSADGEPFRPVASLRGRAGREVRLEIQEARDGPLRSVVVVPERIDPRAEWLRHQTQGAKVVEVKGKKVASMSFFSAAGEVHEEALRDAIAGPFAGADALVLDFRHGWGGASPGFLNLFGRTPPGLEQVDRQGQRSRFDVPRSSDPPRWRKPLVILIDGETASGKEVVAFAIRAQQAGTLVGRRTAGAVLAGRPFPLPDGTLLYLAVADVRVDGERLEGVGVAPHVEVAAPLPFARGADPQLARALEVAAGP